MTRLTVDAREVEVADGATILDAAKSVGIAIPTLCHLPGTGHYTSCMMCVVREASTGRLLPACSAPVREGMQVETDTPEVRAQRRHVLELLLGEHAGDCEAPCRVTCPAGMDIPLVIRLLAAGRTREAIAKVREAIALPGVVGHICPAPCEKGCRRGRLDAPVAIQLLERFAACGGHGGERAASRAAVPARRIAIIGAGPAGLSAAYYLTLSGHACVLYDDHAAPGGQLRYRTSHEVLPFEVLDRDIEWIHDLGVEFRMQCRIEPGRGLEELKASYDAVILAPGRFATASLSVWGLSCDERGFKVDADSLRTSDPQVFAGGEAIHPGKMAVRAMAHGRIMAESIRRMLAGEAVKGIARRFNSRLGRLHDSELAEVGREADPATRVVPGRATGFDGDEAAGEARRCLHCDCRRSEDCRLRELADEYGFRNRAVPVEGRLALQYKTTHPRVIFEPGKCIKCGICVRLSGSTGLGMAFTHRGFESQVAIPFDESLQQALGDQAEACVSHCPTGALAWR